MRHVALARIFSLRTSILPCRARRQIPVFPQRLALSTNARSVGDTNASHSQFLAEASTRAKWKPDGRNGENGATEDPGGDFDTIADGKGKLSPTSSHLFKLILPLGHLTDTVAETRDAESTVAPDSPPATVFLLHPSQPLSHIRGLILAALAPATPRISFRCVSPRGRTLEWSESTDVGNFIRDAARATEFEIYVSQPGGHDTAIHVEVPTFADRTRFLRRRLKVVEKEISGMEGLKRQCDVEAHRGAKRMALGGFGILVVYWAGVARLTFWDFGWDVMEPVTYLSGLSIVILGYSWFLYQGREVSYASVLQRSISARREALYKARGLDIERWLELVSEKRALHREIGKIAEDYDERREQEQLEKERDEAEEREKEELAQHAADSTPELAPESTEPKAKAEA